MTSKCKYPFYLPPFVVFLIIIYSYYGYVICFCVYIIHDILESVLYILFFNVLCILLLWSFFFTVFTPIGTVPPQYKLTDEEIGLLIRSDDVNKGLILKEISVAKGLVIQTRYPPGRIRYCLICRHIKPDRARHCSRCGTCVLKMDHHCPWVNNCIGFSNYKSFLLFLFYSSLYCLYVTGTSLNYFKTLASSLEVQVIVIWYFIMFYGLLTATLLLFHCKLLHKNQTSIDQLQKPIIIVENATYNLGCRRNFVEIFGDNWLLWPFPIFTSLGLGYTFPLRILDNCLNV